MKVSPRERLLLVLLSAVVILFGGFKLLIEPGIKSLKQLKGNYQTAESNKIIANGNIIKAKNIDKQNKTLEDSIMNLEKPFFSELNQGNLLLWLNPFINSNGIKPKTLTLSPPVLQQMQLPVQQNTIAEYPMGDEANSMSDIDQGKQPATSAAATTVATSAANTSKDKPGDTVEMMAVAIEYNGTETQTKKFLDELYGSGKYLKVTSVICNTSYDSNKKSYITDISVNIEFYGIAKI